MNVIFQRGAYLPDLDLWLDSRAKRTVGYISHAHSDHVANHGRPILTAATRELLSDRLRWSDATVLGYGEPYHTPSYSLTLYPAGHCLGSAQVLVEHKASGERTLYTGDMKLRPNPTAEPLTPVPCDTLIIESTFGAPVYRFPPQDQVLESFFATIRGWLEGGRVPVVLAYRLGKSQELLHHLLGAGFQVALEESAFRATQSYISAGATFPAAFREYDETTKGGEVLLFPPGKKTRSRLEPVRNKRYLAMSGWAVHNGAANRMGVDVALPFSDHADFTELMDYVTALGPQKVYTVNGFSTLASQLRREGYQAQHLAGRQDNLQLQLI